MAYPLPVFHFTVDWGGTKLGFTEVSGLDASKEVIEYRDGVDPEFTKLKMPGLNNFGNLTFKRGIAAADNEFFDWYNATKMNVPERRDITVSLLNEDHAPVMTWKVKSCWVTKITSPSLNSTGNEVAIETMEIAHEGLNIENN